MSASSVPGSFRDACLQFRVTPSLLVRFWSKVNFSGPIAYENLGRCWMWTAACQRWKDGTTRYGLFVIGQYRTKSGKVLPMTVGAHRVALAIGTTGRLSVVKHALHKCDNEKCVNPRHVYLGTRKDNTRDAMERGLFMPEFYGRPAGKWLTQPLDGIDIPAPEPCERVELVMSCLQRLPRKERIILSLRFGLNGHYPHKLEEIGQQWGRTRERVRQIESRALKRLRTRVEAVSGFFF